MEMANTESKEEKWARARGMMCSAGSLSSTISETTLEGGGLENDTDGEMEEGSTAVGAAIGAGVGAGVGHACMLHTRCDAVGHASP